MNTTSFLFLLFIISSGSCTQDHLIKKLSPAYADTVEPASENTISGIAAPAGYERIPLSPNSFAAWLRQLHLREKNIVYMYDGTPKTDQSWHYAVVDISTGKRNLQQCADALMRIRAEYLFSKGAYSEINFLTGNGTKLSFENYANGERYKYHDNSFSFYQSAEGKSCYSHDCLMQFLTTVFSYCSTYSLKLMCRQKDAIENIAPGDVLVRPGSPGHAMMVADVAVNKQTGKKVFMLLQSFMPAQDIHIVRNLNNDRLSPWYELDPSDWITTPGYMFACSDLREWK